MGCHVAALHGAKPNVGENVAFDVNDAGRMALGGSLGPEISQIEGACSAAKMASTCWPSPTSSSCVGASRFGRGACPCIKPDYVATTYERKFSRPRTIAVSAVGVGLAAFFVTRSIKGGGSPTDKIPGDSAQTQ